MILIDLECASVRSWVMKEIEEVRLEWEMQDRRLTEDAYFVECLLVISGDMVFPELAEKSGCSVMETLFLAQMET